METVKIAENSEIGILMTNLQWDLIQKILIQSSYAFEDDNKINNEYASTDNFLCMLSEDEYMELKSMVKPV